MKHVKVLSVPKKAALPTWVCDIKEVVDGYLEDLGIIVCPSCVSDKCDVVRQ